MDITKIQSKSTPAMDEYMTFIFQKVMDLYKEVFPEIMAQTLGIDTSEVSSISYDEIMKKLNNMTIDYRLVEKPEDTHISYRDYIRDNVMANLMGRTPSDRNDKLSIHLYEPDISEQTSVSDMMNMIDKDGIPKVLSDINYISHEMAHAFEHILKAQNPSYIDSGALSIQNNIEGKISIDYDPGESFAVSMERIILDKLKESGKLEQYGLSAYMNVEEIENLWQERRINHYEKDFGIVGHTSDGQELSYLDLDLIPYNIMKNQGMETMLQYIKSLDFYKIGSVIPAVDDIRAIRKFCDDVRRKGYEEYLIDSIQEYQPVFSQEDILSIINQTRQSKKESLFLPQEIGKATVSTPTENKDEAKKHIQRDEQIMQQSQEIDDTKSK
ncbi:MAG: hypothetical protein IKE01_04815 [Clostridia bacterium]|nr:hypothetical protein [Clostridia bacterium]